MKNLKLIEAKDESFADALGELRAEIKTLQDQSKGLEDFLKASGKSEIDGKLFHVSVVRSEVTRIDWKKVAAKLEPSHQLVSAHTSFADRVAVKVSAHKKVAG